MVEAEGGRPSDRHIPLRDRIIRYCSFSDSLRPGKNALAVDILINTLANRPQVARVLRYLARGLISQPPRFPFTLLSAFSIIHFHPCSQHFFIWFFVKTYPGMSSMLSTMAFTSAIAFWRLLTDRSSWSFEDGASFFRSAIDFSRSLLEDLLDP